LSSPPKGRHAANLYPKNAAPHTLGGLPRAAFWNAAGLPALFAWSKPVENTGKASFHLRLRKLWQVLGWSGWVTKLLDYRPKILGIEFLILFNETNAAISESEVGPGPVTGMIDFLEIVAAFALINIHVDME
jgi:hypothetical protein